MAEVTSRFETAMAIEAMQEMNVPAAGDSSRVYGLFYTLAVLVMGARMIVKYRHNRYQILRTISVMFFQLGFAFLKFLKLGNCLA